MNTSIPHQFRLALNHLLQQEGRGAQVRLSTSQNIDRGYLNAVVKGRKPAAEEIRVKIASHFGMTYEEILLLGKAIHKGTITIDVNAKSTKSNLGEMSKSISECGGVLLQEVEVAESIKKALEILHSRTEYSDTLSKVIDALYGSMVYCAERTVQKLEDDRIQAMESRLRHLENAVAKDMCNKR